jgi:dimeric dUTPase (all-alpha-NTP-PPase superfamily)
LSIIPALIEGKAPPEVWSYTTVITYAIDMGIVAPALIAAGVMLLESNSLGYLLTATLLVFTAMLGTNLLTAGTIQMLAVFIDIRQFIGFVASFTILTLYAIWFSLALFRNLSDGISPANVHLEKTF